MTTYIYNINGFSFRSKSAMTPAIKAEIERAVFNGEMVTRTIITKGKARNEMLDVFTWVEI